MMELSIASFSSSHHMDDHWVDWRLPILDDSSQPAKHKAHTIRVVGGLPPHGLGEGAQVLVVVTGEVVTQDRDDFSQRERAGTLMGPRVGLAEGVAGGKIRMAEVAWMSDFLERILQHMNMGHIFGVTDCGSQDLLRNGLGQGGHQWLIEHRPNTPSFCSKREARQGE
jgi:hypothetical protein